MPLHSGMPGVLWDLICVPTLQAYVERMFSVYGLLYSELRSEFRSLEMRVCIKLNQGVLKETSCSQQPSFRDLVLMLQTYVGTLTDSGLMVNLY